MSDVKLCKDCKWFLPPEKACMNPKGLKLDYVNGVHAYYDAQLERQFIGDQVCGHTARWFEPKVILGDVA